MKKHILQFFLSGLLIFFSLLGGMKGGFAQIPNADFENWTVQVNDTTPENWSSSGFGASRSSNAQSGNYSVYVWNWYYYGPGYIVNGDISNGGFTKFSTYVGGTPLSEKPTKLHGYYFYILDDNGPYADSAFVNVIAKKYNTSLSQPDTVALGRLHLPPSTSWLPFTVDIADLAPGIDPDSIVISFWSCLDNNCFCDVGGDGNCLFFYVDNISLELPTGILPIDDLFGKFSVFPSVISESAVVQVPKSDGSAVELSLFNTLGGCVRKLSAASGSKISFSSDGIDPGMYILKASSAGKILGTKKLIIQ
ncbi:MAG: T9SS type A sorting domain-containing protein [Bacteroidetes bacterium]|nr:T9SS type A sorting domain-containing protein [Bacteroidota bacterium]